MAHPRIFLMTLAKTLAAGLLIALPTLALPTLALTVLWSLPAAAAVDLAPHRAFYSLSLGKVRSGGGVTSVRGAMYTEWNASCEGWTLAQRLLLGIANSQGTNLQTDSNFSSWESRDGLSYRFTNRNLRNGKLHEDLRGSAKLGAKGKGGKASFTHPKDKSFILPPGTMFPTRHMIELIEMARRGNKSLFRSVFDGASFDGALEVNAVIGRLVKLGAKKHKADPLIRHPSWPLRLAFFSAKTSKSEPDYELGVRLYDNGVAEDFVLDYGDFTVRAKLEKIEALPKPSC